MKNQLFTVILIMFSTIVFGQTNSIDTSIFINPEFPPMYPACDSLENYSERKLCADKAMLEFIYGNLRWPNEQGSVEGTVVISFIVEKNGSLTDIKVVRSLHDKFDTEALRVINMLPDFIPGRMYDKPIRMQMNMPIRFRLE